MSIFLFGLDLGQLTDYTALVGVEAKGTWIDFAYEDAFMGYARSRTIKVEVLPLVALNVRHIERFPLKTPYETMVDQVENRLKHAPSPKHLVIDRTGVGVAVAEMFRRCRPIGLTITAGGHAHIPASNLVNVPKRDLVASLQVPLQDGVLKIAKKLPSAALLTSELATFKAKITAAGSQTFEAWREADHDDLVLATAMPVWLATQCLLENQRKITEVIDSQRVARLMAASQISPI
jgi:hypothetical protein